MKRISKTRRKPITEIKRLRIGLSLVWLFVLLLLLFTGSCTQTDVEEDIIPPHALKEVDAGFNLNVLATRTPVTRSITFTPDGAIESDTPIVGEKDSLQTKATASLTEEEEKQIKSLWVGQYDATTGNRLFSQHISSMTGTAVNLKLKQNEKDSKSHVYFVSNAGDLGEISDEATLQKHILAYESTEAGLPKDNLCKMMGMWDGMVVPGGVKDVTVEMTRLLAKITFTYSIGEGFTFTPTSVELKNAPTISQVQAPESQLTTGGISYKTYTSEADVASTTVYWYLPENMAGTVSGDNAVDSKKKKIGTGVTNATCIELTGDAVQGGVTYKNVTFHFYPGSDMNNYDIIRNTHYTLTVSLVGIDVSDERITVGEIPDIKVDPTEMSAKKGSEKEIQITARPGQEWVFDMPSWLSALLDGDSIPSGATITHQGPAKVLFRAEQANPKAEKRDVSFKINVNGTDQDITITQAGSTLTKESDISLAATAGAEGSSSFTATEGLKWFAALSGGDGWLDWSATNMGTSGNEAPVSAQALKVKAITCNPSSQERSGKIVVKAGASVGDAAYTGLTQEIAVKQAGSTVIGSTLNNIAAKGATGDASFTATKGLAWASSVTSGDWITLNSGASGTSTTGTAQTINYTAAINPSSSVRTGKITVRAGDTDTGPTGDIILNQSGATLAVSGSTTISATASTGTSTFTATPGLSWNVGVTSTGDWLTLTSTTSGTNTAEAAQNITYKAVVNPSASTREGKITVKAGNAVTGTDAGLTKTITVTQKASSLTASIYPTTALAATANASGTFTMNGTKDLAYSFTAGFPAWLSVTNGTAFISGGTTNGGYQQLTYRTASVNPNSTERSATVTVKAGNMTKSVIVKQAGSSFSRTNPTSNIAAAAYSTTKGYIIATAGLAWKISPTTHNGITVSPAYGTGDATLTFTGAANTGPARTGTFTVSVEGASSTRSVIIKATQIAGETGAYVGGLQVCKTEEPASTFTEAYTNCKNSQKEGKSGWRLPTSEELYIIHQYKSTLEAVSGFTRFTIHSAFDDHGYWGSTLNEYNYYTAHVIHNFGGEGGRGSQFYYSYGDQDNINNVRCVRNK